MDSAGDWFEIRFQDNGSGISDDEWQVISGEEEITQLKHGSGLGLWPTKWIVAASGGEVLREDRDDEGTTIRLRLNGSVSASKTETAIVK